MESSQIPAPGWRQILSDVGQMVLGASKRNWFVLALILGAFVTRFWRLWEPSQVVFDEVHFGSFINGYFTGQYFFDIHPPLGKMLMAAGGWIAGYDPGFSYETIGQPFGDTKYLPLRSVAAFFGALLIPLIYVIVRQLGGSRKAASLGAGLVLIESALLTESRFILIDSMLLFFGFLSLALFLAARRRGVGSRSWFLLLALTGVAVGATVSVKWTGVGMMGVVGLAALFDLALGIRARLPVLVGKLFAYAFALVVIPSAVYFGLWMLHFELLPKSGPGDRFMTPEFRSSLEGAVNTSDDSLNPWEKVWELNRTMYASNSGIRATHPWQSSWWSWPFLPRGVSFWEMRSEDRISRIYLLGVPFFWWMLIVAAILFLVIAFRRILRRHSLDAERVRFLVAGGLVAIFVLSRIFHIGRPPFYWLDVPFFWWILIVAAVLFLVIALMRMLLLHALDADRGRFLKVGGLLAVGIVANWVPFAPSSGLSSSTTISFP